MTEAHNDFLPGHARVQRRVVSGRAPYARRGRVRFPAADHAVAWAKKRPTFQGEKVFRLGEQWDHDAFWTQYVPPDPNDFDSADENRNFAGAWLTCPHERF